MILPSDFLILFLISHFLVLMPVMHYFCLCPETDPEWACTCMCPMCAARKGHISNPHNLHSDAPSAIRPHGAFVHRGFAAIMNSRLVKIPIISVETMSCKCGGQVKNIASDIKPFIPVLFFGVLIAIKAFKLISGYLLSHLEIFLPPQIRPG
jgi:hypothetical protein